MTPLDRPESEKGCQGFDLGGDFVAQVLKETDGPVPMPRSFLVEGYVNRRLCFHLHVWIDAPSDLGYPAPSWRGVGNRHSTSARSTQ